MATQWHSWRGLGPRSVAVHRDGAVVLTAVGAQSRTADTLHPAELAVLAQRPEARRADFVVGRRAARMCLRTLGVGGPVLGAPDGRPLFPPLVAGSISHSAGVGVCAAVRGSRHAIGVDLEQIGQLTLAHTGHLCAPSEEAWVRAAGPGAGPVRMTMLFSAKEAIYKALTAITTTPPTFPRITLRRRPGGFTALIVPGSRGWDPLAVRVRRLDRFVLAWVCIGREQSINPST